MSKTRSAVQCPIFGSPSELKTLTLPTYKDIIKYFLLVRNDLEKNKINRNLLVSEAVETVAHAVQNIWNCANIPTLSHQRIVALIIEYQKRRKDILKPYKQRKDVTSYKIQLKSFLDCSDKLFDFAACKCANVDICACPKQNKVNLTYNLSY